MKTQELITPTCVVLDTTVLPITTATERHAEGFDSLDSFGLLEGDSDITEITKNLSGRPAANKRVHLGTVDRHKRGQPLVIANFNATVVAAASADEAVQKELKAKVAPNINKLRKFDLDIYDAYEDVFTNHLRDCIRVQGEPLHHVVRDCTPSTTFSTTERERMQCNSFRKLKAFLIEGPGWAWKEAFDSTEDGRAAFQA
eukprot:8659493-Ditylum_brightwellii.AAC.1